MVWCLLHWHALQFAGHPRRVCYRRPGLYASVKCLWLLLTPGAVIACTSRMRTSSRHYIPYAFPALHVVRCCVSCACNFTQMRVKQFGEYVQLWPYYNERA